MFDPAYIELIREDFDASSNLIGAGGVEKKEFRALKSGNSELTMTYKRPWEQEFEKQHIIPIKIAVQN